MAFEINSQDEVQTTKLEELQGEKLKEDVVATVEGLKKLVLEKRFNSRGLLLIVEGPWGAGKTTTTWALINKLEESLYQHEVSPIFIFKNQSSLLPFGSTNESIRVFLTCLAHDLWESEIFDIREDIQQSILEVAPPEFGKFKVSTNIGPFNFSKNIGEQLISFKSSRRIKDKFRQLSKNHGVVILVLDELDRLRPEEIVSILRLAEQLRQIPRVITIIPIFRRVADKAFLTELNLEAPDAATFMRKFSDYELRIENSLIDLSSVFMRSITHNPYSNKDEDHADLKQTCWAMLLYNLVVQESIQEIKGNNGSTLGEVFSPIKSQFLTNLREHIGNSIDTSNEAYPVHDGANSFIRLGAKSPFNDLVHPSFPPTVNALEQIINNENILQEKICTSPDIIQKISGNPNTEYDKVLMDSQNETFLSRIIVPLLKGSESEPYLTNNYKMRDIKKLASLMGDSKFYKKTADGLLIDMYRSAHDAFTKFRF